jgi:hypothetical protein
MRRPHLTAVLLCTVGLLSGCASKHWAKTGVTAEDFGRDSYQCAQEARMGFVWGGSAFGPSRDERMVNRDLYRGCVQARGYQHVEGGEWVGFRD